MIGFILGVAVGAVFDRFWTKIYVYGKDAYTKFMKK